MLDGQAGRRLSLCGSVCMRLTPRDLPLIITLQLFRMAVGSQLHGTRWPRFYSFRSRDVAVPGNTINFVGKNEH